MHCIWPSALYSIKIYCFIIECINVRFVFRVWFMVLLCVLYFMRTLIAFVWWWFAFYFVIFVLWSFSVHLELGILLNAQRLHLNDKQLNFADVHLMKILIIISILGFAAKQQPVHQRFTGGFFFSHCYYYYCFFFLFVRSEKLYTENQKISFSFWYFAIIRKIRLLLKAFFRFSDEMPIHFALPIRNG